MICLPGTKNCIVVALKKQNSIMRLRPHLRSAPVRTGGDLGSKLETTSRCSITGYHFQTHMNSSPCLDKAGLDRSGESAGGLGRGSAAVERVADPGPWEREAGSFEAHERIQAAVGDGRAGAASTAARLVAQRSSGSRPVANQVSATAAGWTPSDLSSHGRASSRVAGADTSSETTIQDASDQTSIGARLVGGLRERGIVHGGCYGRNIIA